MLPYEDSRTVLELLEETFRARWEASGTITPMESTGLQIAAAVVVTLAAVTYALMIWAAAHRS